MYRAILLGACLLIACGCSRQEPAPAEDPRRVEPAVPLPWKLDLGGFFTVVSAPEFVPGENHYVLVIEARVPGECAIESDGQRDFFGFEAELFDESGRQLHRATDIGSATRDAAPAAAYQQRSPDRICIDPVRWEPGTRVRVIIAPGLEPAKSSQAKSGSFSVI